MSTREDTSSQPTKGANAAAMLVAPALACTMAAGILRVHNWNSVTADMALRNPWLALFAVTLLSLSSIILDVRRGYDPLQRATPRAVVASTCMFLGIILIGMPA